MHACMVLSYKPREMLLIKEDSWREEFMHGLCRCDLRLKFWELSLVKSGKYFENWSLDFVRSLWKVMRIWKSFEFALVISDHEESVGGRGFELTWSVLKCVCTKGYNMWDFDSRMWCLVCESEKGENDVHWSFGFVWWWKHLCEILCVWYKVWW